MAVNWWFHTQNWEVLWGGIGIIPIDGESLAVSAAAGSCDTRPARGRVGLNWLGAAHAPRVCPEQDRDGPAVAAWISAPSSRAPIAVSYLDTAANQLLVSFGVSEPPSTAS